MSPELVELPDRSELTATEDRLRALDQNGIYTPKEVEALGTRLRDLFNAVEARVCPIVSDHVDDKMAKDLRSELSSLGTWLFEDLQDRAEDMRRAPKERAAAE